ncbi:hypothetical protein Mal64_14690 [Pseudobythopirellula maris]|uniref:Uncharacterized protein n=1 Tax=Pseudobythopirellula maris TaxID=2527991 RepID=A0A5C5ZV02_9BACT|nr:hypothetical protein Mal64_14690 [Pseudobythopirellula maris]
MLDSLCNFLRSFALDRDAISPSRNLNGTTRPYANRQNVLCVFHTEFGSVTVVLGDPG